MIATVAVVHCSLLELTLGWIVGEPSPDGPAETSR